MKAVIAFIGAGNMTRSLIAGLLAAGHDSGSLHASDPDAEQRNLCGAQGIATFDDNNAAITDADAVVLAVKPQVMRAAVSTLAVSPGQLIISIAAGVPIDSIAAWTRSDQPIVRCMPNTPALLQAGVTALYAGPHVSDGQRAIAGAVLDAAGTTLWVETEAELDTVTAVSGSGPAYFFYLMEAMIDAAQTMGMSRERALTLTLDTAYGAAIMARQTGQSPARLKADVTSSGGTTERALAILDEHAVKASFAAALQGAQNRAQELAKEFGSS